MLANSAPPEVSESQNDAGGIENKTATVCPPSSFDPHCAHLPRASNLVPVGGALVPRNDRPSHGSDTDLLSSFLPCVIVLLLIIPAFYALTRLYSYLKRLLLRLRARRIKKKMRSKGKRALGAAYHLPAGTTLEFRVPDENGQRDASCDFQVETYHIGDMSLQELKDLCKRLNITGQSNTKRDDLRNLLIAFSESGQQGWKDRYEPTNTRSHKGPDKNKDSGRIKDSYKRLFSMRVFGKAPQEDDSEGGSSGRARDHRLVSQLAVMEMQITSTCANARNDPEIDAEGNVVALRPFSELVDPFHRAYPHGASVTSTPSGSMPLPPGLAPHPGLATPPAYTPAAVGYTGFASAHASTQLSGASAQGAHFSSSSSASEAVGRIKRRLNAVGVYDEGTIQETISEMFALMSGLTIADARPVTVAPLPASAAHELSASGPVIPVPAPAHIHQDYSGAANYAWPHPSSMHYSTSSSTASSSAVRPSESRSFAGSVCSSANETSAMSVDGRSTGSGSEIISASGSEIISASGSEIVSASTSKSSRSARNATDKKKDTLTYKKKDGTAIVYNVHSLPDAPFLSFAFMIDVLNAIWGPHPNFDREKYVEAGVPFLLEKDLAIPLSEWTGLYKGHRTYTGLKKRFYVFRLVVQEYRTFPSPEAFDAEHRGRTWTEIKNISASKRGERLVVLVARVQNALGWTFGLKDKNAIAKRYLRRGDSGLLVAVDGQHHDPDLELLEDIRIYYEADADVDGDDDDGDE
ncbi:hypothetical protein BD626DRAFT_564870 [Schizophyllum amplum]|uniref:Uncharacterized protein n=1 Tax=Schizophyllum amplum TaxID=97359 RepID=A0A550CT77_9AGAR|nr:hypothetical protein BD626DRAFT_564870 [Auriculariopsis ampla]